MKLRHLFCICAAALTASVAQATVLSDNSNITTGIGNGFNGANTSSIDPNVSSTFGYTDNSTPSSGLTYQLADDFTLSANATISGITFDSYSTSTYPFPPTSPFTGASLSIWNAQPGTPGASVLFTSSTLSMTAWTGVYRVQDTTLTNAQRPVMSITMGFSSVPLTAGTYWASWTVNGVAAPGAAGSVFNPPVMNTDGTQPLGNGIQSADGGLTWNPALDNTGAGPQVGLPLTVVGTAVPEPSTNALMILAVGALFGGLALRRRRAAGR